MDQNLMYPTAAAAVVAFWERRMSGTDPKFTGDQLRFFVTNNIVGKASPSTSDRILRMLRQSGKVDYTVENRGLSLYKAVPLGTTKV